MEGLISTGFYKIMIYSLFCIGLLNSCSNKKGASSLNKKNKIEEYTLMHYMTICGFEKDDYCFILKNLNNGKSTIVPKNGIGPLENYTWGFQYNIECVKESLGTQREDRFNAFYKVINLKKRPDFVESNFKIPISNSAISYISKKEDSYYLLNRKIDLDNSLTHKLDEIISNPSIYEGEFIMNKTNPESIQLIKLK